MADEKAPEENKETQPAPEAAPAAAEAAPAAAEAAPAAAEAKPAEPAAKPAAEAAAPAAPAAEGEQPAPPTAEQAAKAEKSERRRRAKGGKHVPVGVVHILATFNNTKVAITDPNGNVVSWGSGGRSGFKGSRKSTAFAATVISQEAARQAVSVGMHEVEVRVQGPGAGRESAVRALQSAGLTVTSIKDVTSIPHNGCRPKKRRRV